jgi:hypothetical protein
MALVAVEIRFGALVVLAFRVLAALTLAALPFLLLAALLRSLFG